MAGGGWLGGGGSKKVNPNKEAWWGRAGCWVIAGSVPGWGGWGGAQLLQVCVAQQCMRQSAAQLVTIRKAAAHENKG